MIKKPLLQAQILFIPLVFYVLFGIFGCGKKGPPVPPESAAPEILHDLKVTIGEWTARTPTF